MLNVNLSILGLAVCGSIVYVCSMSLLGRWLAGCREATSVVYIAPAARGTLRA
jgi:hypothetical protein